MKNLRYKKHNVTWWLSNFEKETLNEFIYSGGEKHSEDILQIIIDCYERGDLE